MSPCRFRYADLPPHLKAQVDALTAGCPGKGNAPRPAPLTSPTDESGASRPARGRREPNKTETAYRLEVLRRRTDVVSVHFEGITLRMANGHRYTPDWVVVTAAGRIECHEVKGSYALHSQQRARLAFDQARVEFPWILWVWAMRTKGGWA